MTIKELRTQTGLSQEKFGNKFKISAINISHWEQGRFERHLSKEKTLIAWIKKNKIKVLNSGIKVA